MYTLAGSLTIGLVILWVSPYTCREFVDTTFDELPRNITCSDGDIVTFNCSVHRGDILWFVNKTFVLGLPTKFNASFKTTSRNAGSDTIPGGENSTLRFICKPQANNSQIQCAVGVDSKLQFDQRAVAFLTVVHDPNSKFSVNNPGALRGAVVLIVFTLWNGL